MTNLAVGFGERIITPPFGVDICGYGFYLDRKAETVLDDLKVRALFLSDGAAGLMMISCDLIGLSVEFSDRLRTHLAAALGLPASRILVACTHTHSGPATQSLTGLGEVSPLISNSPQRGSPRPPKKRPPGPSPRYSRPRSKPSNPSASIAGRTISVGSTPGLERPSSGRNDARSSS